MSKVFGPHCGHDECGWSTCNHEATEEAAVVYGCREQADCDLCGPTSAAWPRLVREWLEWCAERYGVTSSVELEALGVPPNVPAVARLIEQHPVPESATRTGDGDRAARVGSMVGASGSVVPRIRGGDPASIQIRSTTLTDATG
jgi:hypothetical protein